MEPNDLFKFVSLRPAERVSRETPDSPAARRIRDVRERHGRVLPGLTEVAPSERAKRVQAIKRRQAELARLMKAHENILHAVHAVHVATAIANTTVISAEPVVRDPDTGGRLSAITRAETAASAVIAPAASVIDDAFRERVESRLDERERTVFRNVLARFPAGAVVDLDLITQGLAVEPLINEANALCSELQALDEAGTESLPTVSPSSSAPERPVVSAVGWGDLVVARESLVGYVAREIAHIENVLPGETKIREHERISRTEQHEEVETTTETESERESQSTDRYELQAETQQTINQDFSIQTGVNTSGRYGLTKVDTSLDTSFHQSRAQSQSSSMAIAREVVSKAVERTFERVRKLRRLTITEQIKETNRHELKNEGVGGSPPADVSGLYLWLEKVHRVELRHYGTRLMIEFHIPEPAVSLLESHRQVASRKRLPPFDVGPQDVSWANYLCLAKRYRATDVQPPPPLYVTVGYNWASAPSEEADQYTEDTVSDLIAIPDGYRPVSGKVISSALNASSASEFDLFVAVGGIVVIRPPGAKFEERVFTLPAGVTWPNGLPVAARVHGHFDKTMAIQVVVNCVRTAEAYTNWQLRTWEALRAGYEALARQVALEEQQEALSREALIRAGAERAESENRRIERQELQKWAIKAMRLKPHNFNAIEQVGDYQEVSPLDADMQAPIVRMFEDAFEWDQMTYFLYPYYWARRESWGIRTGTEAIDPRFKAFLEAGAARVIVPVTPGFEAKVLAYLESDPADDELSRISALPPTDGVPQGTIFPSVWAEILTERHADLALGSGTLKVRKGETLVTINADSHWKAAARDVGRELYIAGERVVVREIVSEQSFHLEKPYPGADDDHAVYVAGSVPFGPPWTVNVPTSLVVLAGNRSTIENLF